MNFWNDWGINLSITKICFFGASTTEGLGDEARLGWPGRLLANVALGRQDIVGYNLGVRGQTTAMMKKRFMPECQARLTADDRSVIFLSFGLNDVAEVGGIARMPRHRTLQNVEEIITQAFELADEVIWMGPAPTHAGMMPITYANGTVFNFLDGAVSSLNDDYNDMATKCNVHYLDVLNPLLESDYMGALKAGDGLHPNGAGYQLVADLIAKWDAWHKIIK